MQTHHYQAEIFNDDVTTGDAPVTTAIFEVPQGLFPEKIGLWVTYTQGDPGNSLTLTNFWANNDGDYLPTIVNPSITITASGIITVCNPGGGKTMRLDLSTTGTGDDTVVVVAATNVEP